MQRIQQLNGYLDLLSCLFYPERATKLTKVVQAFDDIDLASHILLMVPRNWQDQYKLTVGNVPQSVHKLLYALKCFETAYLTESEQEGQKANMTGGGSSKKRMVTFSDQIRKKSSQGAKHCALCKKHGGMHNAHNTSDCKKYNLDGTPKKGFAGKNTQHIPRNEHVSRHQNDSYVKISTKIAKLEKANELKHAKKKRMCEYVSNSNNSNSS